MQINLETLNQWKSLYEHGDFVEMARTSGIDVRIITSCYEGQKCSLEVFKVVQGFYNARQEEIDSLIAKSKPVAVPSKKINGKKHSLS